ncbi:Iron-binding protein IscA [Candidatus Ecksteinia adelgidicola]|nr:Iron-binding protein IscA [Candidatus Ecksteinia adelgidicola]
MPIIISNNAATHIHRCIKKKNNVLGLRLGLNASGCYGMTYVLELVNIIHEDDLIFKKKGIKLIINKKTLFYINGIEIDFIKEGLNEGFKFNNPNSLSECGCGKSFSI